MRPCYKGDSAAETDEAHSEAEEGSGEQQEDGQEEEPEPEVWWLKMLYCFFFTCLLRLTVLKQREEFNWIFYETIYQNY